jgi:hypothetical protein
MTMSFFFLDELQLRPPAGTRQTTTKIKEREGPNRKEGKRKLLKEEPGPGRGTGKKKRTQEETKRLESPSQRSQREKPG